RGDGSRSSGGLYQVDPRHGGARTGFAPDEAEPSEPAKASARSRVVAAEVSGERCRGGLPGRDPIASGKQHDDAQVGRRQVVGEGRAAKDIEHTLPPLDERSSSSWGSVLRPDRLGHVSVALLISKMLGGGHAARPTFHRNL